VILVDTSVWVDHLRRGNSRLAWLLENDDVRCHSFVLGELALGNLRPGSEVLAFLLELPLVPPVEHDEALTYVERHSLAGSGIGWVDLHLLCASALARCRLWTLDRRLRAVAARLDLQA
jgi:predicted nucleic acid-binding protein